MKNLRTLSINFLTLVLLSSIYTISPAQEPNEVLKDLKETAQLWAGAFNEHDAQELSKLYAEKCDVVHGGQARSSRQEMEHEFHKYFLENPNVSCELRKQTWKVLSPTLVIESGEDFEVGLSKSAPMTFDYTTIFEKRNGKWLAVYERSWEHAEERSADALDVKLIQDWTAYLDGEWTFELQSGGDYAGVAKWSRQADGKGISAKFTTGEDSAREIATWYPDSNKWIARGSGTAGNHWELDFVEVTPTTAKAIYSGRNMEGMLFKGTFVGTRLDANTYQWKAETLNPSGEEVESTGLYKRKTK